MRNNKLEEGIYNFLNNEKYIISVDCKIINDCIKKEEEEHLLDYLRKLPTLIKQGLVTMEQINDYNNTIDIINQRKRKLKIQKIQQKIKN